MYVNKDKSIIRLWNLRIYPLTRKLPLEDKKINTFNQGNSDNKSCFHLAQSQITAAASSPLQQRRINLTKHTLKTSKARRGYNYFL